MPNLGDGSQQTGAGAFGTGTHGSGAGFRNLADMLIGDRMGTAGGDMRRFDPDADPELLQAGRLSLGTLTGAGRRSNSVGKSTAASSRWMSPSICSSSEPGGVSSTGNASWLATRSRTSVSFAVTVYPQP